MAEFGISTLGEAVLVNENLGQDGIGAIRMTFVAVTVVIGLLNFGYAWLKFLPFRQKNFNAVATIVLYCYLVHVLIHTFHYADNIYRPVDYHEPKWLYLKYFLSTMEITFVFNFLHTYFGIKYVDSLLGDYGHSANYLYLTCYVYSAMMTIMHYNIEIPSKYSALVNFSIAGEGVSVFLLVVVAFAIRQRADTTGANDSTPYKLLISAFLVGCTGWIVLLTFKFSLFAVIILGLMTLVMLKSLESFSSILDSLQERSKNSKSIL